MMKQMQESVLALLVLGATTLPVMAAGVDVKVTGTILPAGCTPTLSGGGTINYGDISADSLSATDYTVLPLNKLDFTIRCDSATKVAVKAINGRPGSLAGNTEGSGGAGIAPVYLFGYSGMYAVGLGKAGEKRIGGYGIRIVESIADSKSVTEIVSLDVGSSWISGTLGEIYHPNGLLYYSWAATGTTLPVAFATLSGKLEVQAYLNKASELDLSKPVNLDGLTTIELVYL